MYTEKQILRSAATARSFLPTDAVAALQVVTALPVTTYDEAVELCGVFYVAEKLAEVIIDEGAATPALLDALVGAWRRLVDVAPFSRAAVAYCVECADAHVTLTLTGKDDAEFEALREQVAALGGDAYENERCLDEWVASY